MRLALIPARGGSERIKKKNIIDFCGEPLINYSLKAAKESGLFDKIHVSTDCEEIANTVKKCGFEVDFLRDPTLADSTTGILPVADWVLDEYEKRGEIYNDIFLVMPTAPLVNGEDIKKAFKLHCDFDKKYPTFTCAKFPVLPEWAFHYIDDKLMSPGKPENISERSQEFKESFYDTGSFSILTRGHVKNGIGEKYVPYILPQERAVDIDTYEDLKFAEILYKGLH